MKIGIITITHGTNYGNKLQNYAIVHIFEKMGHEAQTIRNVYNAFDSRDFKYRLKRRIKMLLKKNISVVDYRRIYFDAFSKKFLKESSYVIQSPNDNAALDEMYDVFFSGSDQVWNPNYSYNTNVEFLDFAKKEKRNAFAASFGVEELTEEQKKIFEPLLKNMNHISVREESGADIVENLTGKRPFVSIDPTMLLTASEWSEIQKKPDWITEKKFLVTYLLSGKEEEMDNWIHKVANEKGLEIISLQDEKDGKGISREEFCASPQEFVWLIAHSELVVTDSFHASVFSILHKKPFVVFGRKDEFSNRFIMPHSRVGTLLQKFQLLSQQGDLKKDFNSYFDVDFSNVDKVLEEERNKTNNFLQEVLK